MSLLVAALRTEPSALARSFLPCGSLQMTRNAAKQAGKQPSQNKNQPMKSVPIRQGVRKKDGDMKIKRKPAGPAFHAMAVTNLTEPIFQSETRNSTLILSKFTPDNITKKNVGLAAEFSLPENDPVRIFGLPKKMLLEFRILSKPCSVVRGVTVETKELLDNAKERSSLDTRVVLTGRSGCGKSYLLLQAVEYCTENNWIVLYIPRATNLVNSTTPYVYDLRTQIYSQPTFAYQTLQRMLTVNRPALDALELQTALVLEKQTVPVGTTLSALINIALKDKSKASCMVILETLLKELGEQTKYPVLVAVDEFQALYNKTMYRDPHFNTIAPYHLSMPRLLMEYASGRRSFAKGAFLGAVNDSDPMYPVPLELRDALQIEYAHPMSPYDKRSAGIVEYTKGLRALSVPEKLTLAEATSLFEIWMKDRALGTVNPDATFLSKYVESGGNPRDFVWKGILSTIEA